ncbi:MULTISPECIES: sigma-70 family RNA polymerase sigma factor [unclassified Mucilaginibacter]|uniref:RNA polymerase sigma factor n=1 Tax=unclassified Mucilaginibacter TaxID=2617802 RepID=UPI002AC9EDA6|nr:MULTISPECIES: sigma-70 family RNA polymerase sigma factor [unclassified Mucilaginibacter]MEB0260324.1 sigma-70 family RNA polymerase sigma factor [Mucilaginibacter sp. 10I4]MEB0279363.1 sigma-70 family RNA polymerase sigma factor [Mucilaginibacter sp. 10B2]MEB0302219.1 sigma-70 family RNA polymerase sigma factor [Mucilaginibacter sp. 5C4]WPX21736.1 sigma-70 family RNA polymerase sigma factor [Mucilaginibacter sp. 5C4]
MNIKTERVKKNWGLLVQGDQQGLYACFDIFYDDLYRFGVCMYKNPELVKESINNLFIELWRIQEKLSAVQNVQQYVLTIYKRILYKTYQQYSRDTFTSTLEEADIESAIAEQPYENILIASQQDEITKKRLQKALNQLTPRQIEIVQLRYFDQVSFCEISERTGLTERTIYNTLHNAIKVLREVFLLAIIVKLFN